METQKNLKQNISKLNLGISVKFIKILRGNFVLNLP